MIIFHYQFDQPTVEKILRGLEKLPYEEVVDTIERVTAHARNTLAAAQRPAEPEPEPRAEPRRLKKRR